MLEPFVTVILPSLNVKSYIKTCMDSVVNQSMRELEILCIDAGSTDGTLEILEEYALSDERIKIIHSNIKSYGKQINMGLELARGKYVAIVETDDYIDRSMYEKLYVVAEENQLDFVKADFRGVRTLRNGQQIYDEGKVSELDEVYEKILCAEENPELYLRDVNIWKGIYNRYFLIDHGIRLNETAGAAFQDIGFCMMLLFYAKRGMYIRDMLYYYRRDSDNSSSSKPCGLRFAYQEFDRLLFFPILYGNKELFYHYLYIRMAHVFIGEYEKLLRYDKKAEGEFYEIVKWFQRILNTAANEKIITKEDFGDSIWKKLCLLIEDEKSYEADWYHDQSRQNEREEDLLHRIGADKVIIFGCGHYGRDALLFCDRYRIEIAAFSDNNPDLWGNRYCGYEVCRPSEIPVRFCGEKVLISVKKYGKLIKEQLTELGVCTEKILSYSIAN